MNEGLKKLLDENKSQMDTLDFINAEPEYMLGYLASAINSAMKSLELAGELEDQGMEKEMRIAEERAVLTLAGAQTAFEVYRVERTRRIHDGYYLRK